jgi:DNA-binding response OmpR family regulator
LRAVREGAEGYFIKPVDIQALSARIDVKIAKHTVRAYRILVVDDDEFFLSFFDAVLSSAGMHVKSILDPTEILDAMKKFKPELVLTDLYMPQCNGIEMAKIIRQNNHYLDIPIVFLSSETEMQKQLGALETGADEFLTKPIDPEKLISSISVRAERYRTLRKQRQM